MIVLSLVLVIVAAATLVAGFFQEESLTLIWVSIGACVAAMAALAVGVVQRRRSAPATAADHPPRDRGDPAGRAGVAALADIPGVGPGERQALLSRFGSIEGVREADAADIAAVPGIGPDLARAVKDRLG